MRLLPKFRHSSPPCPQALAAKEDYVTPQADNRSHHSADATADLDAIIRELATLITQAINLEVAPDKIDPDAPLYGEAGARLDRYPGSRTGGGQTLQPAAEGGERRESRHLCVVAQPCPLRGRSRDIGWRAPGVNAAERPIEGRLGD